MAKIIWTNEAQQWLNEIYEYIALDSPMYAPKTIDGSNYSPGSLLEN